MKVSMTKCRFRLFIIWLVGSFLLVILMWLQIAFGHYGADGRKALEWLIPTISPTLALVVGVWAKDALDSKPKTERVKKDFFTVATVVSFGYFFFILLAILLQPFVEYSPLDFLIESNMVLGLLQGIVAAVIGIFFTLRAD